jgi:hypothetical protein
METWWAAEIIWAVDSSLPRSVIMWGVLHDLWVFCVVLFFEKGAFPVYYGTLMAVPDSSPRDSTVVSVRNLQRLTLADGTFFPLGYCAVTWGRASAPAGVAPEALQEHGCFSKVFSAMFVGVRGVSFSQHRRCLSWPWRCHAHVSTLVYVRCISRKYSHASSPRAWVHSR